MSRNKFTVTLRQHTPIIHFLPDQEGATLRATELKPKLDKFLIQKMGGNFKKIDLSKKIGSGLENQPALDYKVQIKQHGNRLPVDTTELPMFFGDLGNQDGSDKQALLYDENTEISFFSINPDLVQLIANHIAEFFAKTNFGMRQSKGYGSFYLHPEDEFYVPIEDNIESDLSFNLNGNNWVAAFKQLETFYKFLRSGMNIPRRNPIYCKSVVFLYAKKELERQWDKKSIKEHFVGDDLAGQQARHENDGDSPVHYSQNPEDDKLLIRDVFGLSTQQSWHSYRAEVTKEHVPKPNGLAQIDRMKSPLTFKIIDKGDRKYSVYCFTEPLPAPGEYFKVKMRGGRINNRPLSLKFPDDFDWKNFFRFLREDVNLDDLFLVGRNSNEYRDLERILNQIQN